MRAEVMRAEGPRINRLHSSFNLKPPPSCILLLAAAALRQASAPHQHQNKHLHINRNQPRRSRAWRQSPSAALPPRRGTRASLRRRQAAAARRHAGRLVRGGQPKRALRRAAHHRRLRVRTQRRNPAARVLPLAFCCSARLTLGAHVCPALPTNPTYPSSCPVSHPSSFLHSPLQLCNHFCGAARRRLGGHARHHALRVPHAAQGAQIRVRPAALFSSHTSFSHLSRNATPG